MPTRPVNGPGFHHVAVRAVDFDRSLTFYTEAIGCTPAIAWGEGDGRGTMLDIGSGDYIELFAGGKPNAGTGAVIHFALRVDDVDSAFAKAVAAGAVVDMEPKDVNLQGEPVVRVRIAFVKGPDGEVIEFFRNDTL